MKRITLVAALTLLSLATFAQAETVPYTSDMRGWTAIDTNNDGNTWSSNQGRYAFDGSGYNSGVGFVHFAATIDDWIVSPAVSLEAGTEYIVRFSHKRDKSRFPRKAMLYAALADDAESLAAGAVVADFRSANYQQWERFTQTYTPAESGDYHFGFYAYSTEIIDMYLAGFEVKKYEFVPEPVSDLAISLGADFAVEATLSWTLPAEDTEGFAFDDDATFNAVYIYRDGKLAQTLPGNATAWTDSEASGMTAADHTYEVEVEVNGVRSSRSSIFYTPPKPLPYQSDFNDGGWTIIDDGNNGNTWSFTSFDIDSRGVKCDCHDAYDETDDWLISPPLPLTAGVAYSVKFRYLSHNTDENSFSLFASRVNTVKGLTSGSRVALIPARAYSWHDESYTFTPPETDYYYLGFRAGPQKRYILMTSLEVINPSITGVDEAATDSALRHAGDTVVFPGGATDIVLAPVSGQVVRRCAAADSLDLSQLAPGVYIVSCNIDGNRASLKIAK